MGPLAPKRQLEDDDMQGLSTKELVDPMVKRRRLEAQERKEGKTRGRKHSEMILGRKPMEQMFRVGDRVCCIEDEGHEGKRGDLGKIGVVREVLKLGDGFCTVELVWSCTFLSPNAHFMFSREARLTANDLSPLKLTASSLRPLPILRKVVLIWSFLLPATHGKSECQTSGP